MMLWHLEAAPVPCVYLPGWEATLLQHNPHCLSLLSPQDTDRSISWWCVKSRSKQITQLAWPKVLWRSSPP